MTRMLARAVVLLLVSMALGLGYLAYDVSHRPPRVADMVAAAKRPPDRPTFPVVVAARDLRAGDRIEADALTVEQWLAMPSQGRISFEGLLGKYVRRDVAAGEPVTDALLARGLSAYLQPGERAVPVLLNRIAPTVRGFPVQPGDLVDAIFDPGPGAEGQSARLLQARVPVLAYGDRSLDGVFPAVRDMAEQNAEPLPPSAVLAVPLNKVGEILQAAHAGRLTLVLRPPVDELLPAASNVPAPAPASVPVPGIVPGTGAALRPALRNEAKSDVNLARQSAANPATAKSVKSPEAAPLKEAPPAEVTQSAEASAGSKPATPSGLRPASPLPSPSTQPVRPAAKPASRPASKPATKPAPVSAAPVPGDTAGAPVPDMRTGLLTVNLPPATGATIESSVRAVPMLRGALTDRDDASVSR